jgi:hypothetical protein
MRDRVDDFVDKLKEARVVDDVRGIFGVDVAELDFDTFVYGGMHEGAARHNLRRGRGGASLEVILTAYNMGTPETLNQLARRGQTYCPRRRRRRALRRRPSTDMRDQRSVPALVPGGAPWRLLPTA